MKIQKYKWNYKVYLGAMYVISLHNHVYMRIYYEVEWFLIHNFFLSVLQLLKTGRQL